MRAPPERQTAAPGANRHGGKDWQSRSIKHHQDKPASPALQALTFTAVPLGTNWQVKCLSTSGDVALFGKFDGRLPALGAAVLMAAQAEGRACP